jgi:hypothetical protein
MKPSDAFFDWIGWQNRLHRGSLNRSAAQKALCALHQFAPSGASI